MESEKSSKRFTNMSLEVQADEKNSLNKSLQNPTEIPVGDFISTVHPLAVQPRHRILMHIKTSRASVCRVGTTAPGLVPGECALYCAYS